MSSEIDKELEVISSRKTTNSPVNDGLPPSYKEVMEGDEKLRKREPVQHEDTAIPVVITQPKIGAGGDADSSTEEGGDIKPTIPEFLEKDLRDLDEMINQPRWVIPVLPDGQLLALLKGAIYLCEQDKEENHELCQQFYKEGLTVSFTKIMTDEAVNNWKYNIHECINNNVECFIHLAVLKLMDDSLEILDVLSTVLNPSCKFHSHNSKRKSNTIPDDHQLKDDELYARPSEVSLKRGWLIDQLNSFGTLGGFDRLLERFQLASKPLTLPVIIALIRPFGQCAEQLTPHTISKYFIPITKITMNLLEGLSDDELKKESSKSELRNDSLSNVIKALRKLILRVPAEKLDEELKALEIFRLKMILRLLQIPSFDGKMNALKEINKVINNVSYYSHSHQVLDDEAWLTGERLVNWLKENKVLAIVLRDCLHQPQYVEKLETIVRFLMKEKALTLDDLDTIWASQLEKHSTIIQNVHVLLTKLAWDFSPEQLDHLFKLFKTSWEGAKRKQRETLLDLIQRLAEDDKDGVMAHKVLDLLWNLAHSEDAPVEIVTQALSAHKKILDYSCSQDRDHEKLFWINKFMNELNDDKWVIPSLRQIQEICQLFPEMQRNSTTGSRSRSYRHDVITKLQNKHSVVPVVAQNLCTYMEKAGKYTQENPMYDPLDVKPGSRYSHVDEVRERLNFLRFLLKDGQLWLCTPQANEIWTCLAENSVYEIDRDACFHWFSLLMEDEPDLDPDITKDFFEQNILQLDPSLLTQEGMVCFDRFFKAVNQKENKLVHRKQVNGGSPPHLLMDNLELIGLEYIWRVVMNGNDLIAEKAIDLLQDTYTNLGPLLQKNQSEIHEDFIQSCVDRLKAAKDTITVLMSDKTVSEKENRCKIDREMQKMNRVLTVMKEYITECDMEYSCERMNLPLHRAARGDSIILIIRVSVQSRQTEDFEIWTHSNATLSSLRKQILHHFKSSADVEMYLNGEIISPEYNRKLLGSMPLKERSIINVKLVQSKSSIRGNKDVTSSPDSSSGSSRSSPTFYNSLSDPNPEAEALLPGDIMSRSHKYCSFFNEISDLGCKLSSFTLRDNARRILQLMPPSVSCVKNIQQTLSSNSSAKQDISDLSLEAMLFKPSSSEVLYNLQVLHALLLPSDTNEIKEDRMTQQYFMLSGGFQLTMDMLVHDTFLHSADLQTKSEAYRIVLIIAKFALTAIGYARVYSVYDALQSPTSSSSVIPELRTRAVNLEIALNEIPNPKTQSLLRNVAAAIGKKCHREIKENSPDINTINSIIKLAWTSGCNALHLLNQSNDIISNTFKDGSRINDVKNLHDVRLCQEALDVLTVALAISPSLMRDLYRDKSWQSFIIDLLLICENRQIRCSARDQFILMSTKCTSEHKNLVFFITLLFTVLRTTAKEYGYQSQEFFTLLCRLLYSIFMRNIRLQNAEVLLNGEIEWLKSVKAAFHNNEDLPASTLLAGHLSICKELIAFQDPTKKFSIGCDQNGPCLISDLVEDFLFTPSRSLLKFRKSGELQSSNDPICKEAQTISAAFEVIVALCNNCSKNLTTVAHLLSETFYDPGYEVPLTEWEYLPPVGSCPDNGYVGLKNAGATCYMNVIIQQLFMTPSVRDTIACIDAEQYPSDVCVFDTTIDTVKQNQVTEESKSEAEKREKKEYVCKLLYTFQTIFGHLMASKLQYYIPREFWKHFRLTNNYNEVVNLREQHDTLEFFNMLTSDLEEGLKHCNLPPVFTNVFGGKYSDQKICKDCPHRYCRDLDFMSLQLDILLHQNLIDSLENYVKGDLLEGDNAYTCEKCNKKVDTVKRMCFKQLPKILSIHLMRFKYDYERKCTTKHNDYFEFTREIDMEPYTVQGLSNIEGEVIDHDVLENGQSDVPTKYRLVGVVVHSGQASGGHYYAYILQRSKGSSARNKWYKFDDGDVQECSFDEEEMRNQCFGGEYMGEVFDHMMKRMSYRKQKRWWNAYLLFYERIDVSKSYELTKSLHDLSLDSSFNEPKLPIHIHKMVQEQNIQFMHERMQYSSEYFTFMQRLFRVNQNQLIPTNDKQQIPLSEEGEKLAMTGARLAAKFLFMKGFRTKKSIRGPAMDWYEALYILLVRSKATRHWFVTNVLLEDQSRLTEYLLESTSSEVRMMFAKLILFLAHFTYSDDIVQCPDGLRDIAPKDRQWTLSYYILFATLQLLKKDIADHGRHLSQYFSLFLTYAGLGAKNKMQLLELDVPALFMRVALDDGQSVTIKYQYAELGKLFAVVSLLVRCCDVSAYCVSINKGSKPLDNRFGEKYGSQSYLPIDANAAELIFKNKKYIKKIIEDNSATEDTLKLLNFLCWENPNLSLFVLSELLWHVSYMYTYELRPYLELLVHILLLDDSWQSQRILHTLQGIPDDREGLLSIIQRLKAQQAKRSYQCIKWLALLFERCDVAYRILNDNQDIMNKWIWAVDWLASELEGRRYGNNMQYGYNNWSPPAQSNESANGYYLERSQSAILVLKQAKQLCSEEQQDVDEEEPEEYSTVFSDPTVGTVYTSPDKDQTISNVNTTSELDDTNTSTEHTMDDSLDVVDTSHKVGTENSKPSA